MHVLHTIHYSNVIVNLTIKFDRSLLKAAVIFVPLLGLTWVFGILAVNEDTAVFAWIFTVLNSLQVKHVEFLGNHYNLVSLFLKGLFILVLYVLRNER